MQVLAALLSQKMLLMKQNFCQKTSTGRPRLVAVVCSLAENVLEMI